jgi:Ran GTPase-activating protein (RanGAP) involved in mRNA processing and transport
MSTMSFTAAGAHFEVLPADSQSTRSFSQVPNDGAVVSFTNFTGEIRVRGNTDTAAPMVDAAVRSTLAAFCISTEQVVDQEGSAEAPPVLDVFPTTAVDVAPTATDPAIQSLGAPVSMVDGAGLVPPVAITTSEVAPTTLIPVIQPTVPATTPGIEPNVDDTTLAAPPNAATAAPPVLSDEVASTASDTTSTDSKDITWEVVNDCNEPLTESDVLSIKKGWIEEYQEAGMGAKVTTIDLSKYIWTAELVRLLFKDLVESHRLLETVETLTLTGVISSWRVEEGYDTLAAIVNIFQHSTVISDLDLTDNPLGTKGIEIVQPLLARPTVRDVRLRDCHLADFEMKVLRETIMPVAAHLTCLDLSWNPVGVSGAAEVGQILMSCRNIRDLHVKNMLEDLSDAEAKKGTRILMQGLDASKTVSLEALDCDGWNFGSESDDGSAVHALGSVLSRNPGLKRLDLSHSGLQQEGLQLVINSLMQSKAQLESLRLDGLWINACQLSEWLPTQAKSLQSLSLEENCITSEGLITLLAPFYQAGPLCRLKYLDLAVGEVDKAGAQLLICYPLASLTKVVLVNNHNIRKSQKKLLNQAFGSEFDTDKADEPESDEGED